MAPTAQAVQITQFAIATGSKPLYIASGPGGNLWFTDTGKHEIGRITPAGQVAEFSFGVSPSAGLQAIAAGPEGDMWFSESAGHDVGRINSEGVITPFLVAPTESPEMYGMTQGPEGNMWFTEPKDSRFGYISPSTGKVKQFSKAPEAEEYTNIVAGSEGDLWSAIPNKGIIARITPAGAVSKYGPLPEKDCAGTPCPYPTSIAVGAGGNLWFNEQHGNAIGEITPQGKITEFTGKLSSSAGVQDLVAGPEGNIWFTENNLNKIGRITPEGAITEFPTGIAGSGAYGIALGAEGNLWFTEPKVGMIAQAIPDVPPIVTTGSASAITTNSAVVGGTVRSRGSDTHYAVEYGPTAAYGLTSPQSDGGSADNTQQVSGALGGLAPATTYHYRLVASNANGAAGGGDQTFTTQKAPAAPAAPAAPRKVSVKLFEIVTAARGYGKKHLRIRRMIISRLTAGERVSYSCVKCAGKPSHGTARAKKSTLEVAFRKLIVSAGSRLSITVTAKDGSSRVRTYDFSITLEGPVLKVEHCYIPGVKGGASCHT